MGQLGTYLLTKKPIKSFDDFKKLKIRAVGAYGKMMRALGASPVVVAYAEIYTSLATNVIDGWAGSNLIEFYDSKAFEVAKYLYPIQISGLQSAPIIINKMAWQGLPDDLKAILEAANVTFAANMRAHCINMESDALDSLLKAGVQWSPAPSADDKAKWAQAVDKVWAEFAAGDEITKELVKTQKEFMDRLIKR
jgi:TRAP-type C4-dicarboxylate transport system substrate-binding protein